jgi:uncharacterized membrane protein
VTPPRNFKVKVEQIFTHHPYGYAPSALKRTLQVPWIWRATPRETGKSMVLSEQTPEDSGKRIVLKPNGSLTQHQAIVFFAAIAAVLLGIAAGFAAIGCWMILPFSGGELLVFAYCLRASMRGSIEREIITVTGAKIEIEKANFKCDRHYEFSRAWVTIDLKRSAIKGHPSRLAIRSHGKEIEVGRFLLESERKALATELKKTLQVNPR